MDKNFREAEARTWPDMVKGKSIATAALKEQSKAEKKKKKPWWKFWGDDEDVDKEIENGSPLMLQLSGSSKGFVLRDGTEVLIDILFPSL